MARKSGTSSDRPRCALCGHLISGDPIIKNIGGKSVSFDSKDHARIYKTAYDSGLLDEILTMPPRQKSSAISSLQKKSTVNFAVGGLYCEGCATTAESVLKATPGVSDAAVSYGAAQGRIEYDPDQTNPEELMHKMHALGYHTHMPAIDEGEAAARARTESILIKLIVAIAFGMQIEILYLTNLYPYYAQGTFGTPAVKGIETIVLFLSLPVFFYSGSIFLRGAWEELKARTVNMNTLVGIGITASFGYSVYMTLFGRGPVFFDSTVLIITFVSIGRYLESIGGDDARRAVRSLLDINPRTAKVLHAGSPMEMPVATLKPGDVVLVDFGDLIPADATVTEGDALVNESLVTGESTPVPKTKGDAVLAGSAVSSGNITARVDKPFDDSRLAEMREVVKHTLMTKPPLQLLADRAAAWLTYAILGVSALTFAGWLATGHSLGAGILAGVAVLVVACPCALGIATPLAITVALGRAVGAGVAVRNPNALETAGRIDHMVFDKTGTLTIGKPTVTSVRPAHSQTSRDKFICLAAAVEQFSAHPVGQAIAAACSHPPAAHAFTALAGVGGRAVLADGTTITVGAQHLVPAADLSPLAAQADQERASGASVVWVQADESVMGYIVLSDPVDPQAGQTIKDLALAGIDSEILSGDSAATVQSLAKKVSISDYTGTLSPEAKAAIIKERQQANQKVGMVGDGANDAPALAQADVSFTVASGTTIAGETSDILLVRDDLRLAAWFIRLSRATDGVIKQNLGWAMVYNSVAVPLAAFGIIRPAIAAIAMAASSLIVVMNSLRLKRLRLG